jgi:hypothetical protein
VELVEAGTLPHVWVCMCGQCIKWCRWWNWQRGQASTLSTLSGRKTMDISRINGSINDLHENGLLRRLVPVGGRATPPADISNPNYFVEVPRMCPWFSPYLQKFNSSVSEVRFLACSLGWQDGNSTKQLGLQMSAGGVVPPPTGTGRRSNPSLCRPFMKPLICEAIGCRSSVKHWRCRSTALADVVIHSHVGQH